MSDHLTEEEQVENLKRLWKEYGTTIIVSVAVATSGYFGWNYWQDQQQLKAETASSFYEQLVVTAGEGAPADAGRQASIMELTKKIKDVDDSSTYAAQAALYAAKAAVTADDLDAAKAQLNWVLDNSDSAALKQIAKLRLARVLNAEGDYEKALNLVADQPVKGFVAEQAEVRGDILREKGDSDAALTAYQGAIEKVGAEQQQRRMVLQMKIDNLKPAARAEEPSA